MRTPGYLAALFFTTLLTACGGGGDDVVVGNSTGGEAEVEDVADVTTDAEIAEPLLGTGSGATFSKGALNITTDTLSAGGSTTITVNIVDGGNNFKQIVSQSYVVTFSSVCFSDGRAGFSKESAVTSSGSVSVTYTAKGCSGDDLITFSLRESTTSDALSSAVGTVNVAPPEIGAITYVGASSPFISLATIGDAVLPKLTTLTFRVVDTANNPITDRVVNFDLTNTSGGLSLSLDSATTDSNGEVTTVLLAGSTHAVTTVTATTMATDGVTAIHTNSQEISVTTGIADQDSFSLSVSHKSTMGWDVYGEASLVTVTAHVNDHFQNPVADGTVVNFVADSGSIESSCLTERGMCSVEWVSSSPLPGADMNGDVRTNDAARTRSPLVTFDASWNGGIPGVASVTAYTSGSASFTDNNANGLYDSGERFNSYAEAYLDANDNGVYDYDMTTNPREDFFDYNANGSFDAAPSYFQGATCQPGDNVNCQSQMHVRAKTSFIVASPVTYPEIVSLVDEDGTDLSGKSCILVDKKQATLTMRYSDINGNVPPTKTQISLNPGLIQLAGPTVYVVSDATYGTDGYEVSFIYTNGNPVALQSQVMSVFQADEVSDSLVLPFLVSARSDISGTLDSYPIDVGTTTITFWDSCDEQTTQPLDVVVSLENGEFSDGTTAKGFKTTDGTISFDIISDGASSYASSGVFVTVYDSAGNSSVLIYPILD